MTVPAAVFVSGVEWTAAAAAPTAFAALAPHGIPCTQDVRGLVWHATDCTDRGCPAGPATVAPLTALASAASTRGISTCPSADRATVAVAAGVAALGWLADTDSILAGRRTPAGLFRAGCTLAGLPEMAPGLWGRVHRYGSGAAIAALVPAVSDLYDLAPALAMLAPLSERWQDAVAEVPVPDPAEPQQWVLRTTFNTRNLPMGERADQRAALSLYVHAPLRLSLRPYGEAGERCLLWRAPASLAQQLLGAAQVADAFAVRDEPEEDAAVAAGVTAWALSRGAPGQPEMVDFVDAARTAQDSAQP